jgi:hypothetical protein
MVSPSASSANRAYQTDYHLHCGLIRQLACKVAGRARGYGIEYEIEDAIQDANLVYVKAAHGYDPDRGITFTAYLGRAIFNELNAIVNKMIDMRRECVAVSIEDLGEEDQDILETIVVDEDDAATHLMSRQEMYNKVASLSPTARLFVRELNSPSPALKKKLNDMIESAKARKEAGEAFVRIPTHATFKIVAEHHQVPKEAMNRVKREFQTKLGVSI